MSADPNLTTQPFSTQLDTLYQSLASLIEQYQQQAISSSLIQSTLAFSEQLIDISKHHPDALLAQLQFYKTAYSYSVNLVFNQVLATYVVASRNQWNDTATQHLLCCVISQFTGITESLNRLAKGEAIDIDRKQITQHNLPLLRSLNKLQLDIWYSGMRHAELRYHNHPELILSRIHKQHHLLSILTLGSYIGLKITRTKTTKAQSFSQVLRLISRKLSSVNYALLDCLLEYPTLVPPGALVSLKNGSYFLILAQDNKHLIGRAFSPETRDCAQLLESYPLTEIKQMLSPQPIKQFTNFDTWWDGLDELQTQDASKSHQLRPTLFKLDTPPPTLLAIQTHLYSDNLDANTLTDLILAEPVFAMHITATATLSARENIAITDVKHGLLMHGFERANSILMDHALTLRLNQHYFPLQEQLLQFCHLYKHIVALISASKKQLTPELMACWAGFASAGLFTSPSLKTKLTLQVNSQGGASLRHLIEAENTHLFAQHAIKLSQSWNQPKQLSLAISALDNESVNLQKPKPHDIVAFILGLGLILAKSTYWSSRYTLNRQDLAWIDLAPALLGDKEFNWQEVVEIALSKAHSYCPL